MGIMEKKMGTTITGYIRVILGLYGDNGKENGNYYLGFRVRQMLGDLKLTVVGAGRLLWL